MSYDIKSFQKRYVLSNKDMADVCACSLPTIQKWRSGEVAVSGAATQLMRLLDFTAEGNPNRLREVLGRLNQRVEPFHPVREDEIEELQTSMTKVVNRLELMLESRRKDRELSESEARYRSMVESGLDPVCRWLPDTTLTYVNEAYAKVYGNSSEELIGRRWIELIPEERRRSIEVLVSDMVRRGDEETMIHESISKDGTLKVQQWRDIPVKNEAGEVIEFHSVGLDVTELYNLRKRLDLLEHTKTSLLALSAQPILIFDQQGSIIEANEAFRRDICRGKGCQNISAMMGGPVAGKLKRVLRRLSGNEEVCYRVLMDEVVLMLKVSVLTHADEEAIYLGLVEELHKAENPVLRVRLQHEIVLDGKRHDFLLNPTTSKRVRRKMEALAETVQVDRVYAFTVDLEDSVFDNVLEWCADGITPHIEDLQRIPITEYPWWINRIRKGQWIQIQEMAMLPRSAFRERDILQAQGICSVLVAPLLVNGDAIGFVGFDHNNTPRVWHEQERKALEEFKQEMERVLAETLGK